MAIGETIRLDDAVSGPANAAASAVGALARVLGAAEQAAQRAAAPLQAMAQATTAAGPGAARAASGARALASAGREQAKAAQQVAAAERDRAKSSVSAVKDVTAATPRLVAQTQRQTVAVKAAAGATGKLGGTLQGVGRGLTAQASRMAPVIGMLARLGPAGIAAAAALGAIGVVVGTFGKVISNIVGAAMAATELRASLGQVTGGRGAEALAAIRAASMDLGIGVEDATKQFVDLREKGLDNVDAMNVIKLRADLQAAGVSAGMTEEAISEVTARIAAGEDSADVIKEIAGAFNVVGDGTTAATKSMTTFSGATARLSAAASRVWDSFADSAVVTGALNSVTNGIVAIAGFLDGINFGAALDAAREWGAGLDAAVFGALGSIAAIPGKLVEGAGAWASAAGDLVAGFISGITGAVGRAVDAAKNMGKSALGALKGALGIGSPSRVAEAFGENVGASFSDAMSDALPDVRGALGPMAPANEVARGALGPMAPANEGGAAPGGGVAGGGSTSINVTVNVGGAAAGAEDIAAAVERAIERALRRAA